MKKVRTQVKELRREFNFDSLEEKDAPQLPLNLLHQWLEDAIQANVKDANAFVLSTVQNEEVDSRVVLLRDAYEEGLEFYTNYDSKKGQDIKQNKQVAINFFWVDFDRQLRIKAKVEKLSDELSDKYFASRPRESQLGAWASHQSDVLASRETLEKSIQEFEKKFEGQTVPRPKYWGGFLAIPYYYEFWQGRASRLHDRLCYEKVENKWQLKRLYP